MATPAGFPKEATARIAMLLREVTDTRAHQRPLCVELALLGQPCGGRNHAYPTLNAEDALPAPFAAQAETGGVRVAGPIRHACEARAGKPVPRSTAWRLLARHGSSTIAPRRATGPAIDTRRLSPGPSLPQRRHQRRDRPVGVLAGDDQRR